MSGGMGVYEDQVSVTSLRAQIAGLEHQSNTILFLSAINMIMNVLTIAVGFLLSMP